MGSVFSTNPDKGSIFPNALARQHVPPLQAEPPAKERTPPTAQNPRPLKRRRLENSGPLTRAARARQNARQQPENCPRAEQSIQPECASIPQPSQQLFESKEIPSMHVVPSIPDSEIRLVPEISPQPKANLSIMPKFEQKQEHQPKAERGRKRKYAVFLGYLGENYSGMQINPGVETIEELLLTALFKASLIPEADRRILPSIHWMRAARTDKGVSAAGQCVSVKLKFKLDSPTGQQLVEHINSFLPGDVRIFGLLRATAQFNARTDCHRRRYEYLFPLRLLGGKNTPDVDESSPEGRDPRVVKLSAIVKEYEGSHSFANFSEGVTGRQDTARRVMLRVTCGDPFLPPGSGVYYVPIEVYGQSFLLHQIRKMVGVALHIFHGNLPPQTIITGLCPDVKMITPIAPALGLLLDTLVFDFYNEKNSGALEKPITDNHFVEHKNEFKKERIYQRIAERERLDRIFETWMKTSKQSLRHKYEDVMTLYEKFILTTAGQEEQKRAHRASLYPILTSMDSFLGFQGDRTESLATSVRQKFEERYGTPATFLARAPGRIIMIGEHLDYNGFPVIGAAVRYGTMVAGCLDEEPCLKIQHLEDSQFSRAELRVDGTLLASGTKGDGLDEIWCKYVSWGVKGFVQSVKGKRVVSGGGRLLFAGDLPRAGGLASSSSLVTASALAAARLNRRRVPRLNVATSAAEAERIGAGTRGGSVDHVLSMCSKSGYMTKVNFVPHVSVAELKWPEELRIVAVGSGVKAEKGFNERVKTEFNLRAAECRIAAAVIAKRLGVHLCQTVGTPGQLMFQARKTARLECRDIPTLAKLAAAVLPRDVVMSLSEVKEELQVRDVEMSKRFLWGVEAETFQIGKRMAHVFGEALRVEEFGDILSDTNMDANAKLQALGTLLNDGQESLRTLYESSCAEVDELISFCRSKGAAGTRLTGAGWGGFTISLLHRDQVENFKTQLQENIPEESVFEVECCSGGAIYAIHKKLEDAKNDDTGQDGTDRTAAPPSEVAQRTEDVGEERIDGDDGSPVQEVNEEVPAPEGHKPNCSAEVDSCEGLQQKHAEDRVLANESDETTANSKAHTGDLVFLS